LRWSKIRKAGIQEAEKLDARLKTSGMTDAYQGIKVETTGAF